MIACARDENAAGSPLYSEAIKAAARKSWYFQQYRLVMKADRTALANRCTNAPRCCYAYCTNAAVVMPVWGVAAQLLVAFLGALVAIAVYRVQADKLFLEFRDERDKALTAFLEACERRQQLISSISKADMVGLVDPDRFEAGNREVIRTAAVVRQWFGPEIGRAVSGCEAAMMNALKAKMEWFANGEPAGFPANVVQPHLDAYTAISWVRLLAAPYLAAGRRGLSAPQRVRAALVSRRGGARPR